MEEMSATDVMERFRRAKDRRAAWEAHWQECYDFTFPQRNTTGGDHVGGGKTADRLFDGTAPDAVDQLAASLMAYLTPPWRRWFGFSFGPDVSESEREALGSAPEEMAATLQTHFDRANFAVEMHQCFLDLVTIGTASMLLEEAPAGRRSAFRFSAVPMHQLVLEEGPTGLLDTTYRRTELSVAQLKERFADLSLDEAILRKAKKDPDFRLAVIEAVSPGEAGYRYLAVLEDSNDGAAQIIRKGAFAQSPYINFRWLKAPGESYGRSPVMKALPDIKTANKVVELILKNASIAVTGIWQADDDGVLNPATVKLAPGAIIPKAVGSKGLTPLEAPGRFDTSQLVLDRLRDSIRSALLTDKLGQISGPRMTATEVLERAADTARLLGATYGRLKSELLGPLILRAQNILRRRGEIADLRLDGRVLELEYRSLLARDQSQREAQNIVRWLDALNLIGPQATTLVNAPLVARKLGQAFGVDQDFIVVPDPHQVTTEKLRDE